MEDWMNKRRWNQQKIEVTKEMMNKTVIVVLMALMALSHGMLIGGKHEVNEDAEELKPVLEAAKGFLKQKYNCNEDVEVDHVVKVEKQLVAGVNYFVTAYFKVEGHTEEHKLTIFQPLGNEAPKVTKHEKL
eukprot:TRINITY_DN136_c0_g1_i4.p2 TRINITY_DN136_c0_g1~~TRINITY_DN136_c0_g1_i4.p2  ORF type:complete len:131 (+),score=47.60 TRINITY_DN136_c0_g1_i4:45-437(+)